MGYLKWMLPAGIASAMVLGLTGCGIDDTGENTVGSNLVSAEVIDDINDSVMLSIVQKNIDSNATFAFGYKAVKITYKTQDMNGEEIDASGLLVIPTPSTAFLAYMDSIGKDYSISSICENHGTIFLDSEAPTNVEKQDGLPNYATAIAMTGYAGFASIIPDYVGYGTSKGATHPYILKDSAQASLDMIRASMRYMTDNGYLTNGQLYISGYSEGGYVALALEEEIEKNHSDEFSVQGVAAMAGPYDVKALGDYELNNQANMVFPAFLAEIAWSYAQKSSDISIEDLVVHPEVFEGVPLFGGDYDAVPIHIALELADLANGDYGFATHPVTELFKADMIEDYNNDVNVGYELKQMFVQNSVAYWEPKTRVNLIQCQEDEIVPYALSTQKAYEYMADKGVDVTLNAIPTSMIPAATKEQPFVHQRCGSVAYGVAIKWFSDIRSGAIK